MNFISIIHCFAEKKRFCKCPSELHKLGESLQDISSAGNNIYRFTRLPLYLTSLAILCYTHIRKKKHEPFPSSAVADQNCSRSRFYKKLLVGTRFLFAVDSVTNSSKMLAGTGSHIVRTRRNTIISPAEVIIIVKALIYKYTYCV